MRRFVYHVNWGLKGRVVPREWTFRSHASTGWYLPSPHEEVAIIDAVIEAAHACGCEIYACMMSKDHMHVLIGIQQRGLSTCVGLIKGRSSFMFNRSRSSLLVRPKLQWQRRFYYKRVRTLEYFINARDYIQTNRQHHRLLPLPATPSNIHLLTSDPRNADLTS